MLNSLSGSKMPWFDHEAMLLAKLSEMSKAPLALDIEASCLVMSGLETPLTVILSWLALKSAMICSSACPSAPPHRYENVISVLSCASAPKTPPIMSAALIAVVIMTLAARRWPVRFMFSLPWLCAVNWCSPLF